jgi:hypothetical protein
MKIGLLSDTHGHLDPVIFDHFSNVDEIWHAGDLGEESLIKVLEDFKPLRAVFGNIDSPEVARKFPEDLRFNCEGMEVWITHIGGTPPGYNARVKKILRQHPPQLFICGHSHILRIKRDSNFNNMIYLNPGAAGNQGFHRMKTIVRFEITKGVLKDLQVIELGLRGAIPKTG